MVIPKKNLIHMFDHLIIVDEAYERLLALFVGSYFVNTFDKVMPRVTDTDLFKTRDQLGEYYLKKHDYF